MSAGFARKATPPCLARVGRAAGSGGERPGDGVSYVADPYLASNAA